MGKVGFILLLIGGVLVLLMGISLVLDPAILNFIALVINTYVGPALGLPTLGNTIADLLYLLTLFGGVLIIVGAVIWYAAGHGCLAFLGKTLTSIGAFTVTYQVVWAVIVAAQTGVFSKPLLEIITYFASLGLGFAAVVVIFVGTILGAGRHPKPKPAAPEPPLETA